MLYMVNRLLHPGHVENIAGFVPFRHMIESLRGPLDIQPLASTIFGLYTGLVYLTPIAGGLIADRWLGRTLTITIGALLMSAGHFLMAFDVTFLLALTCLLCGVGCFKGNLASQVGALYATGDNRRADAFQIYYIFINGGVIAAPLIAGTLGEVYGWHWGFGAAGVGMLIGLTIYLLGRKYLPPDSPVVEKIDQAKKTKLTRRDKLAILALLVLLPFLTIAVIPNQQIFNAYLVWEQDHADLIFFGKKMPTTWLITLDSIVSVSFLFIAVIFWRLWSKKFREPAEITKISIGSFIAVTGMLSLAIGAAIAATSGGKVAIGWLIGFHVLNSAGFAKSFRFPSHSTPASPQQPYLLRSSASTISPSSPQIISWAGLAAFLKKWRPRNSGSCTPPLPGLQELLFFSPAEFSDTFWCPITIDAGKVRTGLC